MKTRSKYLSYASLILIVLLVFAVFADGFSGILLLPVSRFVYYGLGIGTEIPLFIQIFFVFSFFQIIASLFMYSSAGKYNNSRFRLNKLETIEGASIVYMASQALGTKKSSVKAKSGTSMRTVPAGDADQGILMVSSGSIMFANKTFFKITGYQPLDVFGKDFASFICPDSLINYTMLCRMSADEIRQAPGISLIAKNNKHFLACCSEGNDASFSAEGVNVFYIRQAKESHKPETNLANMFFESIENVDSLHWIWDEKGIIYLNNSCRNILPFPLGSIINKPGLMLKSVRKQNRNTIRFALKEYEVTGKFNEEICCRLRNGEDKYFRVSITRQFENGVYTKRNHAIAYDITNEKKYLQIAESAAQEAEEANRNKTAFLANMSHEIRSPLNGIMGFSELLADKNLTDGERERYLSIIHNNGNALISLLSDLIDISKLESGKLEILQRRFVPAKLMDELKYQFENSTNSTQGGVKINFNNINNFRDQEIESDPNRLRQILINLITNAIKFTSKGKIEIGADFSGDEMLFWVKDSGIGIPYENLKAIFDRFRQVESSETKQILGFGLGLTISKALVELLGGRLWVESIPEQGSLFVFTIKTNIVNNTMETTQINNSNSSYPFDFKEHTILIAEDIDFSFLYIEAVLRRTGVKILWAQNGRDAIELVKANLDIDLVLMDMHMPVMNGYEATEVISQLRPGLPIIAQTAFVFAEDVKKCYAAGCTGYLAKPIRKEQLMNTLAEYFEKLEHQETGMQLNRASNG